MKTYILKRLLLMIPTILGITIVTFGIIRLAPGDPAAMRVGSISTSSSPISSFTWCRTWASTTSASEA